MTSTEPVRPRPGARATSSRHNAAEAAVLRSAAAGAGSLLASATGAVASLRRARKPLHPRGEVLAGRIYRRGRDAATGTSGTTGVAWLDEPGEDDVDVRRSRAIGLPSWLPDIHGLAVRVRTAAGEGDLLLATTGHGRISRFTLTASRQAQQRPMTTLLPYRTPTGPVLLGLEALGDETYDLSWARPRGGWHVFGTLYLTTRHGDDVAISFDPISHQLPGLRQYPTVVRLREPAYLRARRSRTQQSADAGAPLSPPTPS
jgi:hypothetical protein